MFKYYHRLSLVISGIAVFAFLLIINSPSHPTYDGMGPSGGAVIAYFLTMLIPLLLCHSLCVSLAGKNKPGNTESQWGLGINAGLIFLFVLPYAAPQISSALDEVKLHASPAYKMNQAIEQGSVEEFMRQMRQLPAEDRKRPENDFLLNAARYYRVDILQALNAEGLFVLDDVPEIRWGELVRAAASAWNPHSPVPGWQRYSG